MPHAIIAGMTTSGKTHLARSTAASRIRAGGGVIVLHKPRDVWALPAGPGPVFQTQDPETFLRVVREARRCFVFVEMTDARFPDGVQIDKADPRFHSLATDSRHEGHEVFFLCQRPVRLDPSIRENVSRLFLFRIGRLSASTLSEEFGDESLLRATALPLRWFLFKEGTGPEPARLMSPI